MKFSTTTKHQVIQYRLCDEQSCKAIATRTYDDFKDNIVVYHLCESHYLKYKAELKDNDSKLNA